MRRYARLMRIGTMPLFLLLATANAAGLELETVLRTRADADRGARLYGQCVACHGVDGSGDINGSTPRIAGQHYRVVAKQLVDFRNGKRWDFRMQPMADAHRLAGPDDIAAVAVHVAGLSRQGDRGVGSGEYVEKGRQIYSAQCAGCHGRDAEGDPSRGTPALAGQHYAYLLRQMYDTVDGRRLTLPRIHSSKIAPLSFEQVRAVSDYLSRISLAAPGPRSAP